MCPGGGRGKKVLEFLERGHFYCIQKPEIEYAVK